MKRVTNRLPAGADFEVTGSKGDNQVMTAYAPEGYQWVETGTNAVSFMFSNGAQSWKPEAAGMLIEAIERGIEAASDETIHDMGWVVGQLQSWATDN